MRRIWLFCALIALCPVLALGVWRAAHARADRPAPGEKARVPNGPGTPRAKLPLTQVVLFNTGLGYFQREGTVEGDARFDLSMPASGINDMLKTLLIDNGGKPAAVSYDGAEPIDQALGAFTVNLASNPTLGQLLNEARGEKVEVTLEGGGGGLAGPLTGVIVGMEAEQENQFREIHHVNLLCGDGVRRLPLARVQRVRFLNPTLEDEFRRALGTLADGRSELRRLVSLTLNGVGKRKVKVAHVAETPIWKASYRLVLDGKDRKPTLQAWAVIQNLTEEDWRGVRVVLVSGRPITFQMDLAQPLFMPRPKVEPAVYASLRPHVSEGALPRTPRQGVSQNQLGGGLGALGGGLGALGGSMAAPGPDEMTGVMAMLARGLPNRYQPQPGTKVASRLTYEELVRRRQEMLQKREQERAQAQQMGSSLVDLGPGIDDVVTTADTIGEGFRYTLAGKVNLARQKSALLSTLDGPIELKRASVYNPAVHPRFPLAAVRLKNSTGQHLMQGPVAVYEAGAYVGDSRMLDLQPGQERLLSYAMDLGVEVRPAVSSSAEGIIRIELMTQSAKGTPRSLVWVQNRHHRSTTYTLRNRSKADRALIVEHPSTEWVLAEESQQPAESTAGHHRFEWSVAAGKTAQQTVVETTTRVTTYDLATISDEQLRNLIAEKKASKDLKDALNKMLASRKKLGELRVEITALTGRLAAVKEDQARLRANLDKAPAGSATQKRFLEKLEEQETKIEKLQTQLSEKASAEQKERHEQEAVLKGSSVK